jgi:alanine-synthesizing transaminase
MTPPVQPIREVAAARRLERVRYAIRDLAVLADELARQGKEILPLNIGDPLSFDFQTPPHLIEAVIRAMRDGKNGYAPSPGTPAALKAVRREAERKSIRNVQTVFITVGVSEAVDACLTALVNPGETVLTPMPGYPLYSAVLAKLGIDPTHYPLVESNDWQPDLEHMESQISAGTRAIVLISPNNPTGAVYSRGTLERIADLARRHHLVIISDEIYDKLILDDEPHISIAALAPDVPVLTLGGLSKAYLVPGWRVGWGILSGEAATLQAYAEGIHKLLRARLSASTPFQEAVPAALDGPQDHLTEVRRKLRSRRDLTVAWCRRGPRLSCVPPRGAFYAFPRVEIEEEDEEFAKALLREKQVLVVHGGGFGQAPGSRHFRVVFLADETTLDRAYRNISDFIQERCGNGLQ